MSNIFDQGVNDDDPDNNMYLNAASIDDEMNGLMDCHRLNVSATDEGDGSLEVKQEYMGDEMDECDDIKVEESNNSDNHQEHDGDVFTDGEDIAAVTAGNEHTSMNSEGEDDYVHFKSLRPRRSAVCGGVVKLLKSSGSVGVDDDNDNDNDEDEGEPIINMNMNVCRLYMNRLRNGAVIENDEDDDDDDPNPEEGDGDDQQQQEETMCQICATVFKTRYNLLRHFQKRHPEYKMYECDLCRISFPSIDEFKDHLEEQHSKVHTTQTVDSKQVRFACDVCGNMYKNKASAMNHLLTHTAKKTVHCNQCDFTCYTKQQLGVHQTKHDKRFVCDICNKRFAQKSQLDVHINAVHYNQRPYVCVLCKKSFKTKGSHDAHMIVHTDTRNYACPYCDKKCRKRYDLTLHIRTHTGEKPFKCSVCGRGFVQMCDTRKHEMLHFKPGRRKSMFYSPQEMATVVDDE